MHILSNLSDLLIPLLIFYIAGYGLVSGVKTYEAFLKGAKDGLRTAVHMLPSLVGLLTAVGILRASGFLDFLGGVLSLAARPIGIPGEIMPLILLKLFSGSAATGMILDLFKTFGPDSYIGTMASIMMSCTETCFYTMSVYFLATKVTRTRYTLPGALFALAAGLGMSVWLTNLLFR